MAAEYRPEILVVDTNALLSEHALTLGKRADKLMTVPEVIAEVRNEAARRTLQITPDEIPFRLPSAEAIAHVTAFSKATGDFPSLSLVDIKVLALTYMLETELMGGDSHLRATPPRPKTVVGSGGAPSASPATSGPALPGFYMPEGNGSDSEDSDSASDAEGDDDDDEGWITPASVQAAKRDHLSSGVMSDAARAPRTRVACITSDFAMQNVLLQMGISMQAADGRIITEARTYVMRCHACFKTTHDMTKQFCPQCGNATLIRTSVSVGPDGQLRLHLKSNFQYRLRGTKYAIPDPKGGKRASNLVLREDQKEYQKALKAASRKQAAVIDVFDVEYTSTLNSSESARARKQHLQQQGSGVKVGYGRRNPNEARRSRK